MGRTGHELEPGARLWAGGLHDMHVEVDGRMVHIPAKYWLMVVATEVRNQQITSLESLDDAGVLGLPEPPEPRVTTNTPRSPGDNPSARGPNPGDQVRL